MPLLSQNAQEHGLFGEHPEVARVLLRFSFVLNFANMANVLYNSLEGGFWFEF